MVNYTFVSLFCNFSKASGREEPSIFYNAISKLTKQWNEISPHLDWKLNFAELVWATHFYVDYKTYYSSTVEKVMNGLERVELLLSLVEG